MGCEASGTQRGEAARAEVGAGCGGCWQHPAVPARVGETRSGTVRPCGNHVKIEKKRKKLLFHSLCRLEVGELFSGTHQGHLVPGAARAQCEHVLGTTSMHEQDRVGAGACRKRSLAERCLICVGKKQKVSGLCETEEMAAHGQLENSGSRDSLNWE